MTFSPVRHRPAPKPGLYKHFKGNPYRVYGIAQHSETEDFFVRYKSLTHKTHWVRPVDMFQEHVQKPELNYSGPRFYRLPWYKQLLFFWRR